eukprot:scaffold101475_cov66-Phaeocystis_antarctica.AAC.2
MSAFGSAAAFGGGAGSGAFGGGAGGGAFGGGGAGGKGGGEAMQKRSYPSVPGGSDPKRGRGGGGGSSYDPQASWDWGDSSWAGGGGDSSWAGGGGGDSSWA